MGNVREVCKSAASGVVSSPFLTVQRMQYYPSGLPWADCMGADYQNRKYNGKEFIEIHRLDEYDSEARWYYPAIMRTTTIDPLAEKYYSISPYAWCGNNPVRFIDSEGRDWYEAENGTITWTDCTSRQELDDNGIKGSYLGNVVVDVNGSLNEKFGKNDNLFGEGAVLATATVYGVNGKDDIQNYDAFTMTSDYSLFGAVADGEYQVNYRNPGKGGALKSNWAVNNTYPVDCIDGKNPSPIHPYSKTQKDGIYIHSSNKNGFAGKYYHKDGVNKGQLKGAISTGCILIVPSRYDNKGNPLNNGWNQFNKQLQGVTSFKLRLNRK